MRKVLKFAESGFDLAAQLFFFRYYGAGKDFSKACRCLQSLFIRPYFHITAGVDEELHVCTLYLLEAF